MLRVHPFAAFPDTSPPACERHARHLRTHTDAEGRRLTIVGECRCGLRSATPEAALASFAAGGAGGLAHLSGTFVLEVADPVAGTVTLLQGPFGARPLHYRLGDGELLWATEVSELLAHLPHRSLNREAAVEVLNYRWCTADQTLVEGVRQLQPGCALTFDRAGGFRQQTVRTFRFRGDGEATEEEWTDELETLVLEETEAGLAGASKPIVLLSGGVDSTLLAALARRVRPDVLAVTPTWSDHPNPELPRARRYAAHLGIQHRVIEFNDVELAEGAMKITRLLEIPNRDFWAIVLLCLLERLAPEADVIIHGEGADSLLGNRSAQRVDSEMRWWRRFWFLPTPAKQALSRVLPNTNGKIGALREVLSEHPHRRLQRMGLLALDEWVRRRHRDLLGDGDPPEEVLAMAGDPGDDFVLRRLSSTIYSWMRVQMGEMVRIADLNGLRMLYPFLGERGLRLAARLPIDLKFTPDRQKKPIVKRAFGRHLPREWADEPKLGFPTPTRPWLRGPLAEWIADRTAPGTVGRAAFGTTVDRLTPDRHYDLIWTLATLEDYRRSMGLELPAWLET